VTGLVDLCSRARFHVATDAVVDGVTALHLHGVEVGKPLPVRLTTATTAQTRRLGVRLSRARALPAQRDGLAVPVEAWRAAAVDLDLVELVAAGDALIHLGLCTLAELVRVGTSATGRGCRLLRCASLLVRERVDSIPESRLRLCLVLAGLPEPRCNVVLDHAGRVVGRVDLLVEEFGLIIEYDGDQHRDRDQWNNDLDRDGAFTEADFSTIRVNRDRMRNPRQLVLKVHARLVERGCRRPPPTFGPEWIAHFER